MDENKLEIEKLNSENVELRAAISKNGNSYIQQQLNDANVLIAEKTLELNNLRKMVENGENGYLKCKECSNLGLIQEESLNLLKVSF